MNKDNFFEKILPFYKHLNGNEKKLINENSIVKEYQKGEVFNKYGECIGLVVIEQGIFKAYTISDEGKEITLYRLIEGDSCIMTASCMITELDFEVHFCFEKNSKIIIIPTNIYENLSEGNAEVKNFTLNLISGRFSDVMWVLKQYVFLGNASRLANAIIEHSYINKSLEYPITHEELANDIGSAREVVSRLLKKFCEEHLIEMSRGKIKLIDIDGLKNL